MTYTKSSPEWQRIMRENHWFVPHAMEYWNSKVLWDTLQPIGNGEWLFLSLEDDFHRTEQLYSVRIVRSNNTIDTLDFQFTNDSAVAHHTLNEHSFVLGSC
jgi:hypothetical protein